MTYLSLLAVHRRILAFGFCLTFFSNFGQTFFIALFGAEIRGAFGLSHGSFGALYSAATLASGLSLIWLGTGIDRFPLRVYSRAVVWGLVVGAALFAWAPVAGVLVVAIYFLRLFGQGLMGHTAMTTMARFFETSRGKAMSVAALGYPVGEAIFPRAFVELKDVLGWRSTWGWVAFGLAVVLVPLVEWLMRRPPQAEVDVLVHGVGNQAGAEVGSSAPSAKSRRDVLRDLRFYFVIPSVLAPPFIVTGLFFHQVHLTQSKGWSLEFFASMFVVFGLAQLVSSLVAGPLVDRFTAARSMPFYLIPLGVGLAFLVFGESRLVAGCFMAAAGLSGGAQGTVVGAYWAERYGTRHLGSIRSLVMAVMVLSTAAAPVAMGTLIDGGTAMESIALGCGLYVVVAIGLAAVGVAGRRRAVPARAGND